MSGADTPPAASGPYPRATPQRPDSRSDSPTNAPSSSKARATSRSWPAEELLPSYWVVSEPATVAVYLGSNGKHSVSFRNGLYSNTASVEQVGEWLVRASTGDVEVS